ncbi:MAG: cupin domain-containing protein [Burkholderiales bacterium]
MLIVHHTHLSSEQTDGVRSLLVSHSHNHSASFEILLIDLSPGAQLPAAEHDGEQVVVVLAGQGKLLLPTGPQRFAAPSSLFIPPHEVCQIVNNSGTDLRLVMVSRRA